VTEDNSPTLERTPTRSALIFAAPFAAAIFLIHFFSSLWGAHLGYGYFRDEMYFLVCGRHLAWGYVDQPPMVALQARLAKTLFGTSPTGVRIFSFAAHSLTVVLTGLLTRQFGGRRPAQALAMACVIVAPVFLGTGNFLTMNSFEPCFWMGSMLVLLRLADGSAHPRAWLLFGLIAGLGIENKHSTVFFLIAVLLGLLLTPQRRILASWYCVAGVAVLTLVALPNFLWQWVHHFPTYEFLHNIAESDKNLRRPPIIFIYEQIKVLVYSTAPIWIGGIIWLGFSARARAWRFVAIAYLVFLALMIAMNGKY
jgi:4-amino-4-deoxy-L-arabinose transferase-like glycosyltransferase